MLRWTIDSEEDGSIVVLEGDITEHASFDDLSMRGDVVVLDLGGVRRINSTGMAQFIDLVRAQSQKSRIMAQCCTPAFVAQLGMLPELAERLVVRSLYVPFECPKCTTEEEWLMELTPGKPRPPLPVQKCKKCKTPMHIAEPEERYFSFLAGR